MLQGNCKVRKTTAKQCQGKAGRIEPRRRDGHDGEWAKRRNANRESRELTRMKINQSVLYSRGFARFAVNSIPLPWRP
jgi:hypothetical protein